MRSHRWLLWTHTYTQWASEAERWGRAQWATGQQNTEVLCSLECSLAHSSHSHSGSLTWLGPKVRLLPNRNVSPNRDSTYTGADIITWSVSSTSGAMKVPSWPWLVSVLNSSVLFERLLSRFRLSVSETCLSQPKQLIWWSRCELLSLAFSRV